MRRSACLCGMFAVLLMLFAVRATAQENGYLVDNEIQPSNSVAPAPENS